MTLLTVILINTSLILLITSISLGLKLNKMVDAKKKVETALRKVLGLYNPHLYVGLFSSGLSINGKEYCVQTYLDEDDKGEFLNSYENIEKDIKFKNSVKSIIAETNSINCKADCSKSPGLQEENK